MVVCDSGIGTGGIQALVRTIFYYPLPRLTSLNSATAAHQTAGVPNGYKEKADSLQATYDGYCRAYYNGAVWNMTRLRIRTEQILACILGLPFMFTNYVLYLS